ncbi:MAG: cation transporter [Butyrivibrio sp.]|nr:cation transporter [Butyrivibrio sp.]
MDRTKSIVRTSIIGIAANILLSVFKAFVGIVSHSVAITMDAVNNLSDAFSSVITIVGAKLSAREPDRKHPYGYGRVEYLSAMVIGIIILYAGITSLTESVTKIIHPETPDYGTPALVIVSAAIVVKIVLGLYTKKMGEKFDSDSLVASGKDALNDSIISTSTLVAAIIFIVAGVSIEAYIGVIISFVILKTGFETLRDTVSMTLGERITPELAKRVKTSINELEEVKGVYDLIIHNYGSERLIGSAHVEIPDTLTAVEIDALDRVIAKKVYVDTGITMGGISVYSTNSGDEISVKARKEIAKMTGEYDEVLQIHGFYMNHKTKEIRFDLVVDIEAKNKREILSAVSKRVEEMYPEYVVEVLLDYNFSD